MIDRGYVDGADFELLIEDEVFRMTVGQCEEVAKGLLAGENDASLEFDGDVYVSATPTDDGVDIVIDLEDGDRYEGTATLCEYFRLTRVLRETCNL